MEKLMVGLKEMGELVAKTQNAPQQTQNAPESNPQLLSEDDGLDLDNIFIEPKSKKTTSNIPENPNKPVKKQPKAKRGISQLPDSELHERLAKMREKAAIVKKQKAEERRKQVDELKQLKLSQKLDIPVDTLAEYETIRKTAAKPVLTEKKEIPEPKLNVDDIVERLFQRINTAKQQEDVRKQESEKIKQQQLSENNKLEQIRKQQEAIKNQRNQAYFTQLGNGKIPKPAQQDQWMALFNRKK
jgi:hypothetical protein